MPILNSPSSSRPEFYDRNSLHVNDDFAANNLAPHSETVRDSYTVPSGKKMFLEAVYVYIFIADAASIPGTKFTAISITPNGETRYTLYRALLSDSENAGGNKDQWTVGGSAMLFPGDAVEIRTLDSGTDGQLDVVASWKGTEFDG